MKNYPIYSHRKSKYFQWICKIPSSLYNIIVVTSYAILVDDGSTREVMPNVCNSYDSCPNIQAATHQFFNVVVEDVMQTIYRQERLQLNFISYYNYLVRNKLIKPKYKVDHVLNVVCKYHYCYIIRNIRIFYYYYCYRS